MAENLCYLDSSKLLSYPCCYFWKIRHAAKVNFEEPITIWKENMQNALKIQSVSSIQMIKRQTILYTFVGKDELIYHVETLKAG